MVNRSEISGIHEQRTQAVPHVRIVRAGTRIAAAALGVGIILGVVAERTGAFNTVGEAADSVSYGFRSGTSYGLQYASDRLENAATWAWPGDRE